VSLGGFGVLVLAFMVTRSLGIGPAASLLGAGQIARHQAILLADFTAHPDDSTLARLAGEAVRMALQESRVVRLAAPASVRDALQRMRRLPTERVTLDLAREIAARDGISVIADGEVLRDGDRYLLRVRLVATDSGNVLATSQAGAANAMEIVAAADRLTRGLRQKIGESLRNVRETPPLLRVTTASYQALTLYSQAVRAAEIEGDAVRARSLLTRAVELDSTFAAAWRKLAMVTPAPDRKALSWEKAFLYRTNATEYERLRIEADYYWSVPYDRPKSLAASEALLLRVGAPHNNFAWQILPVRQYAKSESLYRELFRNEPDHLIAYEGLFWAFMNQGKAREADSAARAARTRFANNGSIRYWTTAVRCGMRQFVACEAGMDSLLKGNPRHWQGRESLAELALMRGQIVRWEQFVREGQRTDSTRIFPGDRARAAWIDLVVRRRPMSALEDLDGTPRPAGMPIAHLYALAGRPDTARAIIDRFEAQVPDSAMHPNARSNLQYAKAALAVAEGRLQEAISYYRASDRLPDGLPRNLCASCIALDIAIAYDRAQRPDSAAAHYEQFLATPLFNPGSGSPGGSPWAVRMGMSWWTFINEAWVHERLGELYQEMGDREKAVRHYSRFAELWKDADPELQPRVATARARIAQLRSS
jgi:tetratricopeptide (TPR) repeat protein